MILLFRVSEVRFQENMSEGKEEDTNTMMPCCASCGTAAGDVVKLKKCTACHLVQYCSVKCQKDHWKQHKKECKKRAAELKDEILFKQPESSHLGDCPICCLPIPIDVKKSTLYPCCCKLICNGCNIANQNREIKGRHQNKCLFCRKAAAKTEEESVARLIERIEANDPYAMRYMGSKKYNERDFKSAFDYWARAAALGDAEAHYQLSSLYHYGFGVEKDEKRSLHHVEQAAIEGHPIARHNLGTMEARNGRADRAGKHFIIAAKLGHDTSLECVKEGLKAGLMSKEDYAAALRGYQTVIEATKSPQREEAAEFFEFVAKEFPAWKGRG